MDSFEEYENALIRSEGRDKVPPSPPEIPGPTSPPKIDESPQWEWEAEQERKKREAERMKTEAHKRMEERTTLVTEVNKYLAYLALFILVAFTLAVITFGTWAGIKYMDAYEFPKVNTIRVIPPREVVEVEGPTKFVVNPVDKKLKKKVRKLNGQNTWLRKLLKKARAERSSDEKYHRLLKYAIQQFYEQPFKPNENSRRICFTTDRHDPECYSVNRPEGYTLREPDKLSPARPTRVGGMR